VNLTLETDNGWRPVEVIVDPGHVTVLVDDVVRIDTTLTLDETFYGLGITASTGGEESSHQVRDFVVDAE
jgi:hypothetical protein